MSFLRHKNEPFLAKVSQIAGARQVLFAFFAKICGKIKSVPAKLVGQKAAVFEAQLCLKNLTAMSILRHGLAKSVIFETQKGAFFGKSVSNCGSKAGTFCIFSQILREN